MTHKCPSKHAFQRVPFANVRRKQERRGDDNVSQNGFCRSLLALAGSSFPPGWYFVFNRRRRGGTLMPKCGTQCGDVVFPLTLSYRTFSLKQAVCVREATSPSRATWNAFTRAPALSYIRPFVAGQAKSSFGPFVDAGVRQINVITPLDTEEADQDAQPKRKTKMTSDFELKNKSLAFEGEL